MRKLFLILLFIPFHFDLSAQVTSIPVLSYPSNIGNEYEFLVKPIGEDSIVCLGEESHWVETYLEVKNGLVKQLHQQQNFDVLIFESGFVNAFCANMKDLQSKERLQETLYMLWQTQACYNLIEYIDESHLSKKPILQLGCDIKGPKSFRFSRFIKNTFRNIDKHFGTEMHLMDSSFVEMRHQWEPNIGEAFKKKYLSTQEAIKFKNNYLRLIETAKKYQNAIIVEQRFNGKDFDYFIRCLENRLFLLELIQIDTYQDKIKHRDARMADNLAWLIEQYVPNRKYIIWAADMHISKKLNWPTAEKKWESMIEHLSKQIDRNIFSIAIKPLKTLDRRIRKDLFGDIAKYYYLDVNTTKNTVFQPYKEQYDGIIFCRKIKSIKGYKIK